MQLLGYFYNFTTPFYTLDQAPLNILKMGLLCKKFHTIENYVGRLKMFINEYDRFVF